MVKKIAKNFASKISSSTTILLYGDLGAGKTTFTQGIAKGWGSLNTVTSPTFVIVNQYEKPEGMILFHMDAYRLENAEEAFNLDIDNMMATGAMIVEWPEKIKEALPEEHLWIDLTWEDEFQRRMVFSPVGEKYRTLLNTFRQKAFGG